MWYLTRPCYGDKLKTNLDEACYWLSSPSPLSASGLGQLALWLKGELNGCRRRGESTEIAAFEIESLLRRVSLHQESGRLVVRLFIFRGFLLTLTVCFLRQGLWQEDFQTSVVLIDSLCLLLGAIFLWNGVRCIERSYPQHWCLDKQGFSLVAKEWIKSWSNPSFKSRWTKKLVEQEFRYGDDLSLSKQMRLRLSRRRQNLKLEQELAHYRSVLPLVELSSYSLMVGSQLIVPALSFI